MELSVRHSSPLNTYPYVREENFGLTRKYVENYLLFTYITIQILALPYTRGAWMGWSTITFLRQREKSSSSPRAAGVS